MLQLKQYIRSCSVSLSLLFMALGAQAQADTSAKFSLGYVSTTGNTDTQTFNTELLLTVDTENWTHNGKFQALASSEDEQTTAERYYLENKSDFNMDETQYLYGKGSYTDDRFSGFEYQAAVSAGYGRHLFKTDNFEIQGYGGLGYRINDTESMGSEGEMIVSLGQNLTWDISDSSSLSQSLETEIGDDLTVTKFEIGLESVIVNQIATKIAFQARHISEVPAGVDNTDTQTSVSLVYEF